MTNLRAALTALVVVLLVLGWGGAAIAAMDERALGWAVGMDAAWIRALALAVLVVAVVVGFVPDREVPS